jgi:hypothetical protein
VVSNVDLLVVEEHAIDGLDSALCGLCGFIVDEAVSLGAAVFIHGDLARQNVSERRKGVMESLAEVSSGTEVGRGDHRNAYLVVNALIQVLDKHVALASLAECRVALRPHDPAVIIVNR